MKNLICRTLICALLSFLPLHAQRNDYGLFSAGDLNGASFIALNSQHGTPVAVTYRSSVGGAAAYRRWLTPHLAAGLWAEVNPSFGVLFTSSAQPYLYGSPLTRYEFAFPLTWRLRPRNKVQPFFEAGPGWIVTHGAQPGWSQNSAVTTGAGVDWQLKPKWAARLGERVWDGKQGCYGDPTCSAKMAVVQSAYVGVAFMM